jgi:NADPH2:quinone reductase
MRAIVSSAEGPVLAEVATPSPRPLEVLARVRAAALNRADLGMLRGGQHGRTGGLGQPLGLEWAGEVIEVGPEVTRWRVGDRVMASGGGAFAEFAVAHERRLYAAPADLSFDQAACFPVGLQTMHDALVTNGALQPGQSVLIQGASSGVGLLGMQIAKALGAGLVIGSSTAAQRRARLVEFGADLAVDTSDEGWVAQVVEATGGAGVDLVVDQVSGALASATMRATRIGGRIVNVGRLGGMRAEFDFDLHALRRITYVGVTFRTRTAAEVERITALTVADLGAALQEGRLRLPIDSTFPLDAAPAALKRMARNEHFGKIVLTM